MRTLNWWLLGVAIFVILFRFYWSLTANKRAKAKRGWNMPGNYTNWITFLTHNGKRIISLEKGGQLEEILEDMSVEIGHQWFYKITYPNSPLNLHGDEPENPGGTPYLQMLLPHLEVRQVWMQREYKGH